MKLLMPLLIVATAALHPTQDARPADADELVTSVLATDAGERVLTEQLVLEAPLAEVWAAYTTAEGWSGWSAPVVEVDLRVGGTISTNYDTKATIGDPGTNVLHILNYVPETLLTLRAELSENWPELLQKDAEQLSNVILFDALDEQRTRVRSFGIGYRDSPELQGLLDYFAEANRGQYAALRQFVESGERRDWTR